MKWTEAQWRAITETDASLLVSAAAGSGKTAVLAERCAYLVCDAPKKCDVSELLVVTFTRPAAGEMRARIEKALREKLDASDDPRLVRQLMLLDRAQINTLHGFCTSVLRQHFHVLGIDPNFRVLDEEEVRLLRRDIAREMLDQRYESEGSEAFQRFIDTHGNGNDEIILNRVLSLHDLMCSVVDRQGWLRESLSRIEEAIHARRFGDSKLGGEFIKMIRGWLDDLKQRLVQLAAQTEKIDGLEPYLDHVGELLAMLSGWRQAFDQSGCDGLAPLMEEVEFSRLPSIKNPPPEKEAIQALIEQVRKEMRSSATTQYCRFTAQQWRDGLASTLDAAKLLVDLVNDFEARFNQAKRNLRGLDFSDLERFTLRILRQNDVGKDLTPSDVAMGYHARFAHVLVDEYQDINEVQDAILRLVSRECIEAPDEVTGNLFCVGDVKQSIYRFRLAQPFRFLERYESFKDEAGKTGRVIDLSSNFRSRGPLLETINSVFERLMTKDAVEIEYDESHRLRPGATYPADTGDHVFTGSPIEMHLLPQAARSGEDAGEYDAELDRTEREAAFVARRTRELVDSGKQIAEKAEGGALKLRPLRYGDIVVLLRSMKHKSEQFASILRTAGIPVHTDSATGFFNSMEIRDIVALLKLLDNQKQDIPMAAVLRSPLAGLAEPEDCLARIRMAYRDRETPFHEAVVNYATEKRDELAAHLRAFLRDLGAWRKLAHTRPLAEVVWTIYDVTGYLAFCAGMTDGEQRVANLTAFHERARQFGTFQRQGLSRFMQFLQSLEDESDLGQPSVASEADDVVRVMSIHRSKGLEFPVVFVPDVGKKHNLQDTTGTMLVDRDAGIGLMVPDEPRRVRYPSLAHVIVQDRIRRQSLAEEMRVLYVAMTRAREHLVLVGTCPDGSAEQWKQDWSNHHGAMPAQRILAGRSMLDWLGPAAAAIGNGPHRIDITCHSEEELKTWSSRASRRPELSDQQQLLARLEPLNPPPAENAEAQRVIERLTTAYPFAPFTTLPAVQSVGQLTKALRPAQRDPGDWRDATAEIDRTLALPRCAAAEVRPSAAEIGVATHSLMEHLDFARASSADEIRGQIDQLVEQALIPQTHAAAVDVDAILWFCGTDLGKLLRDNADGIHREVAVHYPLPVVGSNDPHDRIMVRGRIDLFCLTRPTGSSRQKLLAVDFKTDRLAAENVQMRADSYAPQLKNYAFALGQIVGRPVDAACLVFLNPRQIIDLLAG